MDSKDIECYRINYNVDGWREVAHWKGELCVPFCAVLAINALCDEVESLRKDAERYRWLCDQDWEIRHRVPLVVRFDQFNNRDDPGMNLDVIGAAIDKAMEE